MSKRTVALAVAAIIGAAGASVAAAATVPAGKPAAEGGSIVEQVRHGHRGGGVYYRGPYRYGYGGYGYGYRPYAYGFVPGVVLYNSGPSYCSRLYWKAKHTGSHYWWARYRNECA